MQAGPLKHKPVSLSDDNAALTAACLTGESEHKVPSKHALHARRLELSGCGPRPLRCHGRGESPTVPTTTHHPN